MCFSATASFGASALLSIIGVATLKQSKTTPQKFLACIPLIFAVQQFAEGFVWLSLTNPEYKYLHHIAMYAFLVFAEVVWPVYVPLAVLINEKKKGRKKILAAFLMVGMLTGGYLFFCLFYYPSEAIALKDHIRYQQGFPWADVRWGGIFYFIPTVISSFVVSIKQMRLFGIIMTVSCIFTRIFYSDYIVSIWCFFAAILSVVLLSIIIGMNKDEEAIPIAVG